MTTIEKVGWGLQCGADMHLDSKGSPVISSYKSGWSFNYNQGSLNRA